MVGLLSVVSRAIVVRDATVRSMPFIFFIILCRLRDAHEHISYFNSWVVTLLREIIVLSRVCIYYNRLFLVLFVLFDHCGIVYFSSAEYNMRHNIEDRTFLFSEEPHARTLADVRCTLSLLYNIIFVKPYMRL